MAVCPQGCQDKHNKHEVSMTKLFGKIDNLNDKQDAMNTKLDETIEQIKFLAEQKADKRDLEALQAVVEKEKESNFGLRERLIYGLFTLILMILGFLAGKMFNKLFP